MKFAQFFYFLKIAYFHVLIWPCGQLIIFFKILPCILIYLKMIWQQNLFVAELPSIFKCILNIRGYISHKVTKIQWTKTICLLKYLKTISLWNIQIAHIHKQKHLMLANINEVCSAFKDRNSDKIGFSKFCDLRPKWCVTVGGS